MGVLTCQCGADVPRTSKGYRSASWLDRVDGATVRVSRTLLRVSCRCGHSSTPGLPTLEEGHRMTPAVADAIVRDALEGNLADAAEAHLTNRTTVADVIAKRLRGLSDQPTPEPQVMVLRSQGDACAIVLACEAAGRHEVIDAFSGPDDPRLRTMVLGRVGRIHADWDVGCAVLIRWPRARVTICAPSCLARVWASMSSCVRLLRAGLDRSERRVLAGVRHALVTPPLEMGIADAADLERASQVVPVIRRFVLARDRLASSLSQTDRRVFEVTLDGMLADPAVSRWFRPLVHALDRMRGAILNGGYGRVSAKTWAAVSSLCIRSGPGEPASRSVARHLLAPRRHVVRRDEARPVTSFGPAVVA